MTFIRSVNFKNEISNRLPFDIPAIKFGKDIDLDLGITIFMGQNGCGKTSFVESIALKLDLDLLSGTTKQDNSFQLASKLQSHLEIDRIKPFRSGFFFRAEDLQQFVGAAQVDENSLYAEYSAMGLKPRAIRDLCDNQNYSLRKMRKKYGDDLRHFSHGEGAMAVLKSIIHAHDVLILDEPEIGMNLQYQRELIHLFRERKADGDCQMIITTHSPLIGSMQDATLYVIEQDGFRRMKYRETQHYRILKDCLDNLDDGGP